MMFRCFYLVIVLELCSLYNAQSVCGYTRGSDGLFYKFHHRNVDWRTAKMTCERENARLAIINSAATFEYIKNAYTFHMGGIWVGARDMDSQNDWRWTNFTSVKKRYWHTGEPNNYRGVQEDCGLINYFYSAGLLFDAPCAWQVPKFLCQKEFPKCVKEKGRFTDGPGVSTVRLGNVTATNATAAHMCLEKCLAFPDATGCAVVQESDKINNKYGHGCYVTTEHVTQGNGDERHFCWILSKCKGSTSLAPPQTACNRPYHCYKNRAQVGYDISFRKAFTLSDCSHHCCRMAHCQCIGFDWRQETNECWLSQTPRDNVPTSNAGGIYSCEFKDLPAGYRKVGDQLEFYYKFYPRRVNWHTAKLRCQEDGGHLVIDDSQAKHNYLSRTLFEQTYWIGASYLEGSWKYVDEKKVRLHYWDWGSQPNAQKGAGNCVSMWSTGKWRADLCSTLKPFVCEVPSWNVTTHPDKKHENPFVLPFVVIVFLCVLAFISFRALLHHRMRRRGTVSPPPSSHEEEDHVASNTNQVVSQHVAETVNPSVPKPMDTSGIAVIPTPPQYMELYPQNQGVPGDLLPPPAYNSVIPADYVIPGNYPTNYPGNSSSMP